MWKLRLVPNKKGAVTGDCWYDKAYPTKHLSPDYFTHNSHRAPIVICMPDGAHWSPDAKASGHKYGLRVVGGNISSLTVRPPHNGYQITGGKLEEVG